MRAVCHERYGPPDQVLQVEDVPMPMVGAGDVLVRVRAASVHPDVWHVVEGVPYVLRLMGNGVRRPKRRVPGTDLAGVVESVGRDVSRLKAGDEVYGESVKFGWHNGGAYAEYAAVPQELLALKPENVTFEQAAAVPTAGYIALSNLQGGELAPGKRVLINGACGCVGTLAIQMAKAAGATVTAVDCGEKLPLATSLGADHAIDYTKENVLRRGERYDFILDVASTLWFDVVAGLLTPTGSYVPIGHAHFGRATGRMGGRIVGSLPAFITLMLKTLADPKKRRNLKLLAKPEAMAAFTELLASGKLTPVIARTYPLEAVREAMRCMIDGRTIGRLIMTP